MVDNIQSTIDALNCINGHGQHCKCDSTGAISLTKTTDLQNGNKYITPSEAVVSFEVNNKVYQAFGCPVNFEVGNSYKVEFGFTEGVNVQWDVMFSENKDKIKDLIIKPNSTWSYSAYGQVLSINPVIVDCGIGEFDLGYLSRDERLIGEYIFFDILRLDVGE